MKRTKIFSLATFVLALAIAFTAFAPSPVQARPAAPNSIVDIALAVNAESGEFSTLIAALQSAGLVETLASRGQYTVFAPTDAAFAALGLNAANIGSLPVETLTNILLYHVSPGARYSGDVVSSDRLRMLNKGFTFVSVSDAGVFINQAKVLAVDIQAGNGVIHIIDSVLLP